MKSGVKSHSMLLRIPFTLILASAFVVGAFAQDGRLSKAGAVVDAMLEIDSREQARLAAEDMLRQTKEYEFRAEYEEFFISVSQAPEYRAAKARAFAEAFTEQELGSLCINRLWPWQLDSGTI